ncbi:MAG: sel1 repeat family protein [Syntrophaceae bacterium]|nr:sel1 repeat family protein [Syntrophaceae bacterium]
MIFLRPMLIVIIFLFGVLAPLLQPLAGSDIAEELRHAQALLAKGEYEKAFAEYRCFAEEKNNPLAQFTLGLFFQYGWGRPADSAAACTWYEKAAAGNIPTAAHFYAECLEKGVGRPVDAARAAEWYERAADLGHHMSLCALSALYMTGKGVPKDPARGLAFCRKAAEQNVVSAQVQTALYLLQGDESIRDYDEAFQWFYTAARGNSPEAPYYLGIMLRDGIGRAKAPQAARSWFESAASRGYGPAYFPTGELYFHAPPDPQTGKPTARNLAKAYLWLSAEMRQTQDLQGREQAEVLLKKVLQLMPVSWRPELDAKVDAHFSAHPPQP